MSAIRAADVCQGKLNRARVAAQKIPGSNANRVWVLYSVFNYTHRFLLPDCHGDGSISDGHSINGFLTRGYGDSVKLQC